MKKRKCFRTSLMILLIMALPLSFVHFAKAQSWEELIKKAEEFLSQGKSKDAESYFYATRDFALKQDNLVGVIRAGYGFAALNNSQEAIRSWSIARELAWKQENWDVLFRAGQSFAMLGDDYKEAYEAFRGTRELAEKQGKWVGLFRAGQGFIMLKQRKEAEAALRGARELAEKQEDWAGLFRVGQGFAMLGDYNEAERLSGVAESLAAKQGEKAKDMLGKRIRFFPDTLLFQTIEGIKSGLASEWKIMDDKSIIMYLKKDIKCFDGKNFEAESVSTTFKVTQKNWEALGIRSVYRKDDYVVQIISANGSPDHLRVALTDPLTSIRCRE